MGTDTDGKALVIGSGFGGMFVGANVLSVLADRLGRRRVFLWNLAIYSLFTLAAAFSPNLAWLAVLRFCAGFGLGGELTLSDTYLASTPARRPRALHGLGLHVRVHRRAAGGVRRGPVRRQASRADRRWRWLLVSDRWARYRAGDAAQPARVAPLARDPATTERTRETTSSSRPPARSCPRVAPQARNRGGRAERGPRAGDLRAALRAAQPMLWFFQFFQTVGYYGFGTLAPLVLAAKGYKIVDTLGFTPPSTSVTDRIRGLGPDHRALRAQAPDRRLGAS